MGTEGCEFLFFLFIILFCISALLCDTWIIICVWESKAFSSPHIEPVILRSRTEKVSECPS